MPLTSVPSMSLMMRPVTRGMPKFDQTRALVMEICIIRHDFVIYVSSWTIFKIKIRLFKENPIFIFHHTENELKLIYIIKNCGLLVPPAGIK